MPNAGDLDKTGGPRNAQKKQNIRRLFLPKRPQRRQRIRPTRLTNRPEAKQLFQLLVGLGLQKCPQGANSFGPAWQPLSARKGVSPMPEILCWHDVPEEQFAPHAPQASGYTSNSGSA
jgi:hypothetical protein